MNTPIYYDEKSIKKDAMCYLKAREFLDKLRLYRKSIDTQIYRTLRGQALNGDLQGAERGLERILRRDM